MRIRVYQPGDEAAQVEIYNEAAANLPKFKPATIDEVRRRCQAAEFDPQTRFYAEEDGRVVGYAGFHANGRLSYPWCRTGSEAAAEPLYQRTREAMTERGMPLAFAAYRSDWQPQRDFFVNHGFVQAREMVNFVIDPVDMPTRPGTRRTPLTALKPDDLPVIFKMACGCLRARAPEELGKHLLANPQFSPNAVFVLRNRFDDTPVAVGVMVVGASYADPYQVDSSMPCFRLGAFGTEGMQTKKINGLFSFLAHEQGNVNQLALDLMGHAASLQDEKGGGTMAAQVPSDASHLLRFYQRYFRRQGSFPVYERRLNAPQV